MAQQNKRKMIQEITPENEKHKSFNEKPFHYGFLREITDQYESGDISYGKMVELLNDVAIKWHNQVTISKTKCFQNGKSWKSSFLRKILIYIKIKLKWHKH